MRNGLPYYKAYPRDFMEGTIGMPFELKGAYRLLLDLIYMQAGRLFDEPKYISGHLGCSVRAWGNYRAALVKLGKIQVDGEFISNFRATLEIDKLEIISDKQRENASQPRKNKGLPKAMDEPKHSHTEPEPDTEEREEPPLVPQSGNAPVPPDKPPPKQSRRCRLPDGWVPSERNIQDAEARKFTAREIQDEADRFRDHHYSRGTTFADWDAGWRTWLGNARKFGSRSGMAGQANPGGRGQGGSIASIVARRWAAGDV